MTGGVFQVICWRAVASMAWSVLLLLPTTALFVVLSRFSLFHPILWISECLSLLTSASAIFSFILLCGVVLLVGFFNLEYYTGESDHKGLSQGSPRDHTSD
uniref:Nucleoporin NDC1 n=1 Tax=Hucho hucho TaxID=62062 RepID=A0A4W5Q754_9TELE